MLLKKRDLARWLSLTPRTIDAYVKSGVLPAPVKIANRVYRWRADEVAARYGIPAPPTPGGQR